MNTDNLIIIPHIEKYENVTNLRIPYCYLHGQLQTGVGYDCFGFKSEKDGYVEDNDLKEGIYPCTYDRFACTFFYWKGRNQQHRGLVVLNDDIEAVKYANHLYEIKSPIL